MACVVLLYDQLTVELLVRVLEYTRSLMRRNDS